MKNKFYILLVIILCTGCTAKYEISIKDDKVVEKLNIEETNTSIFDIKTDSGISVRDAFKSFKLDTDFSKNSAKIEHIDEKNKLGIVYSNELLLDNYNNSSILNQCYDEPTIDITKNSLYINTGSEFNCFDYYEYLDEIKIVLKTNYKVDSNNADSVRNNTYTWNITKNNYNRKSIELKINRAKTVRDNTYIYILVGIVAVVIVISIAVFNMTVIRSKQVNKF